MCFAKTYTFPVATFAFLAHKTQSSAIINTCKHTIISWSSFCLSLLLRRVRSLVGAAACRDAFEPEGALLDTGDCKTFLNLQKKKHQRSISIIKCICSYICHSFIHTFIHSYIHIYLLGAEPKIGYSAVDSVGTIQVSTGFFKRRFCLD